MYSEFAEWYDTMMHSVDYDGWALYLEEFLKKHECRSIMECACGTGNITLRLAKKGYSMSASDVSEDMLMVTRSKMMKAGLRFPLICQDMRKLQVHKSVDAVISVCDGVNYLTDSAEDFFNAAYNALKPGGLLLFDISSEYKLSRLLGKTSFSEVNDEWAFICDCDFVKKTNDLKMYLTCFVKSGSLYKRFEEYHVQHAYSIKKVQQMLYNCGFSNINAYEFMTSSLPVETTERIQFSAVKPLV